MHGGDGLNSTITGPATTRGGGGGGQSQLGANGPSELEAAETEQTLMVLRQVPVQRIQEVVVERNTT